MTERRYEKLEQTIGYQFQNEKHLEIAFTHKSYANENVIGAKESYERYEFLGDAILEFIVSEFLFEHYASLPEGKLTKLRASLVCEFTLSKISRELMLGSYGLFSKGEKITGGNNRDSILCDMFESLLGAIYLDGGLAVAKKFVYEFLLTDIEHKQLFYDSKSMLQEYAQKHDKKLSYELIGESGPEHNKSFYVEVLLDGKSLARGEGHSRKSAEQLAAYHALKSINYQLEN
ncbi:MAG: ribonuclease III [Eubacteriales bacterium]|nr:ribonuclease III [Eubacteriales bacterium]